MRHGPLVFLAAFFALSASWMGFVLAPQVQIGRAQPAATVNGAGLYPNARPGLAQQGLDVYRANGCAYCHTLQVNQKGTAIDVLLTDAGTNAMLVADTLVRSDVGITNLTGPGLAGSLPRQILRGGDIAKAESLSKALKSVGAKTEMRVRPTGTDIDRSWGTRRTVAHDFLYDYPVMLGSQRVGPDLANVGQRRPDANWHLQHLYAPAAVVEGSPMPAYPFLFRKQPIRNRPSPDALQLSGKFAPPEGFEIVPTDDAKALAAYLASLRADGALFETPMAAPPAPAPAGTNAPAK